MVERGRMLPSVVTAMTLADALGCQVAELFQKPATETALKARLSATICFQQGPVRLALVGDEWVAIPVAASENAGFGEADGELVSRHGCFGEVKTLAPEAQLHQNLLMAGCDPALGIVGDLWKSNNLGGSVRWQDVSNSAALEALVQGEAHVAGICFPDVEGESRALAALGMEVAVVRFARWEQGWMLRRGNPLGFRSVEDLASNRVRFLNQVDGSGSRLMLDGLLEEAGLSASRVPLYSSVAASHFDCAEAIREGRADVALGQRAVAACYNLDFLPVREVEFDLVIPQALLGCSPVESLLKLLQHQGLITLLDLLPGYTTAETGKRLFTPVPATSPC